MPADPSYNHSKGSPQTFTLRDGRTVELRNGCLVESESRAVLTGSHQTTGFLLEHALLTNEERFFWEVWGDITCDRMNSQDSMKMAGGGLRRSNRIVEQMKAPA